MLTIAQATAPCAMRFLYSAATAFGFDEDLAIWLSKPVGVLLLVEVLLQQPDRIVVAEVPGPFDQRAVAADLVVLDSLSGADHAGIQHLLVLDLLHMLLGFIDDAFDRLALLAARRHVQHLEHLIEPLDLAFGFLAVGLQRLLQLLAVGFLDHARQGFEDLLLGVVDVLEGSDEQIVHRLDRHGELLALGVDDCFHNVLSHASSGCIQFLRRAGIALREDLGRLTAAPNRWRIDAGT